MVSSTIVETKCGKSFDASECTHECAMERNQIKGGQLGSLELLHSGQRSSSSSSSPSSSGGVTSYLGVAFNCIMVISVLFLFVSQKIYADEVGNKKENGQFLTASNLANNFYFESTLYMALLSTVDTK